jgi:hypothetical protein
MKCIGTREHQPLFDTGEKREFLNTEHGIFPSLEQNTKWESLGFQILGTSSNGNLLVYGERRKTQRGRFIKC